MRQRWIITCIAIGLLVNAPLLFAQGRSRGLGRAEQLAALESIQRQIEILKDGLQQPSSQTGFRPTRFDATDHVWPLLPDTIIATAVASCSL